MPETAQAAEPLPPTDADTDVDDAGEAEASAPAASRTRREEYAEATYTALLDSAAACFFEHGYFATSLDEVAKRARVTKGAIYHHFASKRELFVAVLERLEKFESGSLAGAGSDATDAWSLMLAALDAFLEQVSSPNYQRLCWVEGPAALGFEAWWQMGERHEIEVIRTMLERAKAMGGGPMLDDIEMVSHVIFGAVCAGVLRMVRSEDQAAERERFRSVFLGLMSGLLAPPAAPGPAAGA